ncbi:MAG: hypothetical protein STSR0003_14360 [Smithella sp.]
MRQGPRFFKALAAATKAKPIIILKVGTSESGAEAAVSAYDGHGWFRSDMGGPACAGGGHPRRQH